MKNRYHPTPHKFSVVSVNAIVERFFHKDFFPRGSSGISREEDSFFYKGEMHDFWEIVYVEKGTLTVSEDEKVYELEEGQVIFHAPMEFHRFWAKIGNAPVKLKIFSFDIETNLSHNLSKGVFDLDIDQKEKMVEIFNEIQTKYSSGYWTTKEDTSTGGAEEARVVKMFETFLLDLIIRNDPDKTQNNSTTAKRYKEVIKTLKEHIHESLTIEDVARLSHLSVSYIKKLFALYAGCGVMQYFNRLKIIKAMKYLEEGKTVSEVSDILSFSGPNYFSVAFKNHTGISPSKYAKGEKQ